MTTEKTIQEQLVDESHALIEGADPAELMLEAMDAVEPGDAPGTVVHRPTQDTPFGIVLEDVDSAGYKVVYHTVTREASVVNGNMLESQLSKMTTLTDPDGTVRNIRAFTTRAPETWNPPAPPPDRGTLLCIFHKDAEMYDHYKTIGIFPMPTTTGYCPKSNMVTLMDVRTHAQHRHKNEWESVEADRTATIEAEEREIRRMTVENLRAERLERESTAAPVAVAPEQPVVEPETGEIVPVRSEGRLDCSAGDWYSTAPKSSSRSNAFYRHKSEKH